jgi:hypothetical protein
MALHVTPDNGDVIGAQERVLAVALNVLRAERGPQDDPNWDAERQYAEEQLALAARDLACAVEALPAELQPVGWGQDPPG